MRNILSLSSSSDIIVNKGEKVNIYYRTSSNNCSRSTGGNFFQCNHLIEIHMDASSSRHTIFSYFLSFFLSCVTLTITSVSLPLVCLYFLELQTWCDWSVTCNLPAPPLTAQMGMMALVIFWALWESSAHHSGEEEEEKNVEKDGGRNGKNQEKECDGGDWQVRTAGWGSGRGEGGFRKQGLPHSFLLWLFPP